MKRKEDSPGETLTETLAAIVVLTFAFMILAGSIVAFHNVSRRQIPAGEVSADSPREQVFSDSALSVTDTEGEETEDPTMYSVKILTQLDSTGRPLYSYVLEREETTSITVRLGGSDNGGESGAAEEPDSAEGGDSAP